LAGKDNEEKAWNYFKGQGLNDVPVAGIMGNFMQESSFNPEEIENGGNSKNPADAGGGGWGIAQWTPGAKVLTEAQTYHINGPIYELATQLNIIWAEMKGTSPTGVSDMEATLKQKTDLADATSYFVSAFEGPSIVGPRLTYAQQALQKYGGSGGGSGNTGSSGGCMAGSGSPDCTTATGNLKILCEAKKYDPVDYVWGGGHAGGAAYHTACSTIEANNPACGLDCSGLVSVAVYDAFGNGSSWNTDGIASDSSNWKEVSFSQLRPGDTIVPDPGHVEIVDHVKGNIVYTFGGHTDKVAQPDQVGPTNYTTSQGDGYKYFHYVGQGSS
jgi:cell wall-associated NlpC family hydrolase